MIPLIAPIMGSRVGSATARMYRASTELPDGTLLAYEGNPNDIALVDPTSGEATLSAAGVSSMYSEVNGNVWIKAEQGVWLPMAGTDVSTVHLYFKYDPVLDQLVATRPITTTLNSIYLESQIRLSSSGDSMLVTNMEEDIDYHMVMGGIRDHTLTVNHGEKGIIAPFSKIYGKQLLHIQVNGGIGDDATLASYETAFTPPGNESLHALTVKSGQDLNTDDAIWYRIYEGSDNTGRKLFEQLFIVTDPIPALTFIQEWADHPNDTKAGKARFAELTLHAGGRDKPAAPFMVVASETGAPWVEIHIRTFDIEPISLRIDLGTTDYAIAEEEKYPTLHDHDDQFLTDNDGKMVLFSKTQGLPVYLMKLGDGLDMDESYQGIIIQPPNGTSGVRVDTNVATSPITNFIIWDYLGHLTAFNTFMVYGAIDAVLMRSVRGHIEFWLTETGWIFLDHNTGVTGVLR